MNDDGGAGIKGMAEEEWLKAYEVGPLPSIFYIPNYLTPSDQSLLLHQVTTASPASKWKILKNRRLQNWGGIVTEKGLLPQALPQWLSSVTERIAKDTGLFPSALNHVLINEYHPGQGILSHQDGPAYFPVVAIISLGSPVLIRFTPHSRLASATTLSSPPHCNEECGGKADLKAVSLVLLQGSLLIFKDSAYQDYLHGIDESYEHTIDDTVVNWKPEFLTDLNSEGAEIEEVSTVLPTIKRTGTRVSLTCRLVPRVHKNLIRL